MARDDRKIVSAIRMPAARDGSAPRRVFRTDDDVDELQKVATPEQLQSYADAGAITGNWKGVKAVEADEAETKPAGKPPKK